jgi:transcriptional adapter 2-alpha
LELDLCERVGIQPIEFIAIKEVLIRESVREGFLKKEQAENIIKLGKWKKIYLKDKDRLSGVFDFLVLHNYILEK